jgi:hypothetical protein
MAPPKKPGVARHIQITPYVRVKSGDKDSEGWWQTHAGDARTDRALAWLKSQPSGTVQSAVWNLFVAAVNGELGVINTVDLDDEDKARQYKALNDLLKNMVIEED